MTYGCLGIHQNSTVQRYRIYQLTEYIRHMFTTKSPRENLLIQMQLILACKVHILVRFFVFKSFPIHAGDCCILKKGVNGKWRVATFMKSCDFYEMLLTLMKSCDFYRKLWLLWKVTTILKDCDFSKGLWPFRNKNLFVPPFVFYKLRDFLSF